MADPVPQSLSSWHICNAIFLKSISKKFNASRHILLITTFNWISTAMLVACWQAICLVDIMRSHMPEAHKKRCEVMGSLSKQPTFGYANTGFPTKWHLRKEHRNSILMTHHYPDLGTDASSVWNFCARFSLRRHLAGKPVVAKSQLFSQARWRAGKERVALLSFPLRALPLTFMFSYTCSACYLKWKSWSLTTTSDAFFKQYCSMGLWVTFVCDATNIRYTVQTPSCVQLITSLTLDWQSKESYFKKMIQVL